jgi:undecaprenyl-diphosphatase
MMIIAVLVAVMIFTGASAWALAVRWPGFRMAPTIKPADIEDEVVRHPRLAAIARSRLDAQSMTGLALTVAAAVVIAGAVGVGVLLFMVRRDVGVALLDLGGARFGARHATTTSTSMLRTLSQFGGAVVLVPLTVVVGIIAGRRRPLAVGGFLALVVLGQFAVANTIKALVDRARPDLHQLTNFNGSSFPSGHAVAGAAAFAAFALVLGRGRSPTTKIGLAAAAAAIAAGIATTRVLLGVHWITDVLAGLATGWAWFALCSIAFGGRLLAFGEPAAQAERSARAGAADPVHTRS